MPKRAPVSAGKPAPSSATDAGQIKRAKARAKRRQERYEEALRTMMATNEGAIVLWHLLGEFDTTRSVARLGFDTNQVLFLAGRQDAGFALMADMLRVDSELYVDLERAMRTIDKREEEEERAARTPSVSRGNGDSTGETE